MATAIPVREMKTEDNLHYVLFGENTEYKLANKGFTDWTQSMNANTDDGVQYIGDKNSKSQILGYAPSVSYGGTAYPSDDFDLWVYQIGKLEKVGETFQEVEVETWNEVTEGVFHAYHRTYEVQPDNPGSGEGGGKLTMEGTFTQTDSVQEGYFNMTTKEFSTEAPTAGE
ncbi:MAG: hypothetical protein J6D36_01790 [Erysipelotrichaceae bacterium]|nr:hypothetical protein [Erysipelotrichaceae bacterium]